MNTALEPVGLSYIAVASRDMDRTASFLGDDLGLARFVVSTPNNDNMEAFRVGDTAVVLFPVAHPFLSQTTPGVDHIALAAADPITAREASGRTPLNVPEAGLNNNTQAAIDRNDTCSVDVRFAQPLQLPEAAIEFITRIDHIGIASADNAAAENIFCRDLGAVYESRQTDMEISTALESFTSDKYGAVYHTRKPEPVGGLRVSFLTVADLELEFLQNFDPTQGFEIKHGTAGNTKQDQSAIGRFVASRGGGLHHIAFKVDDIDAILQRLSKRGHQMIDTTGRPGSRRARIGFVHPSSTGGILFHFVERAELN